MGDSRRHRKSSGHGAGQRNRGNEAGGGGGDWRYGGGSGREAFVRRGPGTFAALVVDVGGRSFFQIRGIDGLHKPDQIVRQIPSLRVQDHVEKFSREVETLRGVWFIENGVSNLLVLKSTTGYAYKYTAQNRSPRPRHQPASVALNSGG